MNLARKLLRKPYRKYLALTYAFKQRFGRPVNLTIDGKIRIRLLPEGQIARCLHGGPYEAVQLRLFCRYLKPGMTVIDIGANVGLYSVAAEKRVAPRGIVWAVEPSRDSHERLLRNLRLNAAERVTAAKVALSAGDEGSAILLRDAGQLDGERYLLPQGAKVENVADSETVPAVSLDAFCKQRKIGTVDFIKMDIEGGEYEVFRGAREILTANPELVMVFEHTREGCARAGITPDEITDLLSAYGFQLFAWNDKKKAWDSTHDYILSNGSAWAAANSRQLPRL